MPELKLVRYEPKTISLGIPMQLAVFVEKGQAEILFKTANGISKAEMLVTNEKRNWNKDEMMSFINFEFISLSDVSIIHYHLERL